LYSKHTKYKANNIKSVREIRYVLDVSGGGEVGGEGRDREASVGGGGAPPGGRGKGSENGGGEEVLDSSQSATEDPHLTG
jgi:hypothetical protein